MQKIALKTVILLLVTSLSFSCSSSDDNSSPTDGTGSSTNSTWQLGPFGYTGGVSSTNTSNDTGIGVVAISTIGNNDTNGDYAGSSISVTHALNGDGTYSIVSSQEFVTMLATDSSAKILTIFCVAGTLKTDPLASTQYGSDMSSGRNVLVNVDSDGRYHFSTRSSINLIKTEDIGTGIPNAPDNIDFTMDDIYDFSN